MTRSMKPESMLTARMRRLADEHMRAIDSGADLAANCVRDVLGDVAAALLEALSPEDRARTAREAFRRLVEDGATPEDVTLWLSVEVRHMRWRGEDTSKAASRARSERQRGAHSVNTVKRAAWQAWRDYICENQSVSHPSKAAPGFKSHLMDVVEFRGGASIPEPALNKRVPNDLPTIVGQGGGAPSRDSIRKNLFGRSKNSWQTASALPHHLH